MELHNETFKNHNIYDISYEFRYSYLLATLNETGIEYTRNISKELLTKVSIIVPDNTSSLKLPISNVDAERKRKYINNQSISNKKMQNDEVSLESINSNRSLMNEDSDNESDVEDMQTDNNISLLFKQEIVKYITLVSRQHNLQIGNINNLHMKKVINYIY